MNAIRTAMSVFLGMVVMMSILGWMWSSDLPSPKRTGARVALGMSCVMSLTALGVIWREKPRKAP